MLSHQSYERRIPRVEQLVGHQLFLPGREGGLPDVEPTTNPRTHLPALNGGQIGGICVGDDYGSREGLVPEPIAP